MADVIREFLVALGFKIDDRGYQRFQKSIGSATVAAAKLGATVAGVATTIGLSMVKVSDELEELYWASQRAGASANNLRAFGFGARQIGIEAGEAGAAVERLRLILRTEPGKEGMLNQLGIKTREANGQMRDTTKIAQDLVRFLKGMPDFIAAQYGSLLGIDPQLLFRWQQGLEEQEAAQAKLRAQYQAAGVDLDKLTEAGKNFQNALRELSANVNILYEQMVARFLPYGQKFVQLLINAVKWLQETSKNMTETEAILASLGVALVGTVGAVGAMRAALGLLGVTAGTTAGALGSLLAIATKLSLIGLAGWGGYEGGKWLHGKIEESGGAEALGMRVGDWLNNMLGRKIERESETKGMGALPEPSRWLGGERHGGQIFGGQTFGGARFGGAKFGNAARVDEAMKYFMSQGWTREQAAGIVANLQRESGLNPEAFNASGGGKGAYGIAQWREPGNRQSNLFKFAGTDKPTFEQQLAFIQHELNTSERGAATDLRGAKTAEEAADSFLRKFERPGFKDYSREYAERTRLAERYARQGQAAAPQVSQTTNITVTGTNDPEAVARRVLESQGRVNAELTRNLAGALK